MHLVVKAMGEDGKRLNIRRETLRGWRGEFARHLRAQGVAANATPRQVRGEIKPPKFDGIYRAALRGASTHQWAREEAVARELAGGEVKSEPGKDRLLETRRKVVRGWNAVAYTLVKQDQVELALAARRFVDRMPAPRTEKEQNRREVAGIGTRASGARNDPMSRSQLPAISGQCWSKTRRHKAVIVRPKAGAFCGRQSRRGKSRSPVAWVAGSVGKP